VFPYGIVAFRPSLPKKDDEKNYIEISLAQDSGRITAQGHAKHGTELAEVILARLGMHSKRHGRIVWVIRHQIFHHSWQLESPEDLTSRQRTYLTNPDFPLLLEFLRIDTIASHGKDDSMQAYQFNKKTLAIHSG
jgi:hypothetical protein